MIRLLRAILLCSLALGAGFGLASRAEAPAVTEPTRSPSSDDPGVRALLDELDRRSRELDLRERALDERAEHVEALEARVEERLQELEQISATVERRIQAWEEGQSDKVRRLAKIYGAMKPQQAAQLIEGLDVGLATQIVARMKEKQSAAVLAYVSEDRALAMSRRVARPLANEPTGGRR